MNRSLQFALLSPALLVLSAIAQEPSKPAEAPKIDTSRGDRLIAEYFRAETEKIQKACLAEIKTLDDWNAKKGEYRRQLLEMLGLDPLPEKSDLKAEVTGRIEHGDFAVENLYFQSRPGLYVTGNLYLPKKIEQPLPAILYVCGHGAVKKDGVSYGNKVSYQHHGAWFARNGYICLTIDTLQLGEIEGIHHGTYRYDMWWWLNRGYTPAGVEAWNCVRALDYLETRPEVDKTRFGVTGRSGGGAYSWWIAAIDDRIKCAVPVAGITDLQNHVIDGCVEGHCDCMYMVNTYRWDYPQVAALVAPRPLLISNTDSDGIFPLDGVYRTFEQVRRIYRLYDATEKGTSSKVALNISPGPHKDTQELQLHAFRWFNHYLKGDDKPVEMVAEKFFEPEQLKVFKRLPTDEINTKIHETFVRAAGKPRIPNDSSEWLSMQLEWSGTLGEKAFGAWPLAKDSEVLNEEFSIDRDGVRLTVYDFNFSQEQFRVNLPLKLFVLRRTDVSKPERLVLKILDADGWQSFLATTAPAFGTELKSVAQVPDGNPRAWDALKSQLLASQQVITYFAPPGIGPTAFGQDERKRVQMQRRLYLLGCTLDSLQLFCSLMALSAACDVNRSLEPIWVESRGSMAGVALYMGVFSNNVEQFELYDLPKTHRDGPYFLNVSRYLDMPQAVAMAAERSKVVIYQDDDKGWEYPRAVAERLGWDAKQIQIRKKP